MRSARVLAALLAVPFALPRAGAQVASGGTPPASGAPAAAEGPTAPGPLGGGAPLQLDPAFRFDMVWPEWRDAVSFSNLGEYFGGSEHTGKRTILRSRPQDRTGCYFVTRIENHGPAVNGARFVLEVILPDSADPRVYPFSVSIPQGSHLFEIGVTGKDWPGPRIHAVAWLLELRGPDGRILARRPSFVWEQPAG